MQTVLFCFLFVASVFCDVDIEPRCSRFDIQHRMIERLVKLEQKSVELEIKRKELQEIIDVQGEEIQRLKTEGMSRVVIAEIKLPAKQTFADGDTIVFTDPVINTDNAYNTDFGIFEPPVNGTYSFSATVCTHIGTWMVIGLIKDNDVLDEIFVGDTNWEQCATSTAVAYVTSRNKIWVKLLRTSNGVTTKDFGISSFTGVLLTTLSP